MLKTTKPTLAAARSIILETIKQTSDALNKDATKARGALNAVLWDAQRAIGAVPNYFSQSGQDMLLDQHVFTERRGGVFLDIGCDDGATGSNTLYFEVFRGWTGLLIDARSNAVAAARDCRTSTVVQAVVGKPAEEQVFIESQINLQQMSGLQANFIQSKLDLINNNKDSGVVTSTVSVVSINALLAAAGIGAIDLVSLDVEGAEMDVLREFDFDLHHVKAWVIENSTAGDDVAKFMSERGYALVDYLGDDEIYVDAETQAALVAKMSEPDA